jgi:gliding motility-associated protein GldE
MLLQTVLLDTGPFDFTFLGQFILFFLLIICSFFASASEVALFSLSRSDIEFFRNDTSKSAQRIWSLVNEPKRLLATILITNNFVNIAAILVASTIMRNVGNHYGWDSMNFPINLGFARWEMPVEFLVNVLLITSVILLFGEIMPKVYAARHASRLVTLISGPLYFLREVLRPLSFVLIRSTRFIDKRVQQKEGSASLEDLRNAIHITPVDDDQMDEREILKGIVNLSHITVKSIMRARVDVKAVEIETPLEELIAFINEHNYSRLPVYESNLDHILGLLHIKDLLPYLSPGHPELDLRQLVRPVMFIPESKKIDTLLEEFKSRRLHMAVVVDEFGGTEGIVTLEDVIEEIFGEINDEFDNDEVVYTRLADDTFIFDGKTPLNDIRKILRLADDEFDDARGESDSLAGLLLELHGKFPTPKEVISYKNYDFLIESVSKTRIAMVKVVIKPVDDESARTKE